MDCIPGDEVECCDLIVESYKHNTSDTLYMLVNNLDGIMLQGDKCQAILARLASVPNIHLIATIDHINAPLCKY
jgi:origin recognition complex subunit 2